MDQLYPGLIKEEENAVKEIRERLMEILNMIDETIDYEAEEHLIDDRLLDSFAIITLVAEMGFAFDVVISARDMVPENFNSLEAMARLVERLRQ